MTDKLKTIAFNIRRLRESKDYTQLYMAAKLHISQNAQSKFELGYTTITLERLYEICEILEIEVPELMNLELLRV